ncbi:hypothetical protein [Specibacter sp. NPDC078692]|uniref:hypothetical protein n=1 Tax=Specibacter sp. NPDC078692 TaxID=3155818 RepID=UPI0034213A2D
MDDTTEQGFPDPADLECILAALRLLTEAQHQGETSAADTLKDGASVREAAAGAGISTNTVQRWGCKHGWPTTEQRTGWEADRAKRDEWTARLEAASAVFALLGEVVA